MLLRDEKTCGFSAKMAMYCEMCAEAICEDYLCHRVGKSHATNVAFEINTRATLAFRGIGCGFSSMKEWCGIMNLHFSLSQNAYATHNSKLHKGSIETVQKVRNKSLESIITAHKDVGITPDDNGVLEIAVSFDGAWHRRGHSSHVGLAVIIDVLTGLPIDYEVLCNFCVKCKDSTDDKVELSEKHATNCQKNYDGSANSMEVECALRSWRRSEEHHHLRYTVMLSDGDSKAFDAVVADCPYGEDAKLSKEDCVNHVSKRMGAALRNLSSTLKAQKQSISGKGKLTQEKITKIQNYYGRAIKDNAGNIEMMKKRIFAILFHLSSTDETPKHMHCPPGEKSWCFWQRAIAQEKAPGPHKDHDIIPADVGKKLVPIFKRLTDENLLSRCSRNKAQNPNESIHNVIWRYCPKSTFVGRKTMETGVALAFSQFSMGATSKNILCQALGIVGGTYLEQFSNEKDMIRIRKAQKAGTEKAKRKRKELKFKKVLKDDKKKRTEGVTYSAGSFNA